MDRYSYKKILGLGFVCLFLLLCINELAVRFHIFYIYKWFDTPMHFLGGFGVGIVALGLLRWFFTKEKYDNTPQFWYTLFLVLGVGLVWELVEVFYKVSVIFGGSFWFDTIKDLLMDTFGGILSYICFHQRLKK